MAADNKSIFIKVCDSIRDANARQTLEPLFSDKFVFNNPNAPHPLTKSDFLGMMFSSVLPSFPDFNFNVKPADFKDEKDGRVSVTVHVTATHTGAAYTLAPGFPVIPAANVKVTMPAESCIAKFENGKFIELSIDTVGGAPGGPLGLYLGVGGKMPAPDLKSLAMRFFNSIRDANGRQVWDSLVSDKFVFTHPGAPHPMAKAEFLGMMFDSIVPSFPDFNFNVKLADLKEEKDRITVALGITATHTGAPFTLAPGLPLIKAANVKVTLPTETSYARFENGKIVEITVQSVAGGGAPGGPLGLYLGVGGKMPPADAAGKH